MSNFQHEKKRHDEIATAIGSVYLTASKAIATHRIVLFNGEMVNRMIGVTSGRSTYIEATDGNVKDFISAIPEIRMIIDLGTIRQFSVIDSLADELPTAITSIYGENAFSQFPEPEEAHHGEGTEASHRLIVNIKRVTYYLDCLKALSG